jgi:hypothetical protein
VHPICTRDFLSRAKVAGAWNWWFTNYCWGQKYVDLYIHFHICLYGVVLGSLNAGTTSLYFTKKSFIPNNVGKNIQMKLIMSVSNFCRCLFLSPPPPVTHTHPPTHMGTRDPGRTHVSSRYIISCQVLKND